MMQSLRPRTKISEIGFGVLQIGGFIEIYSVNMILTERKNGGHYHFPTAQVIDSNASYLPRYPTSVTSFTP
jgi:hypothetical protein